MLDDFIKYLLEQVANHSIYVWGAQGQKSPVVCEAWIRRREQDTGGTVINGKYRTYADIAVEFWKKQVAEGYGNVLRAFDCSGLVVFWLLNHKLIKHDMTANGLYGLCKPTNDLRAGYWVFRLSSGRATHIGVLVDDHTVVEARGRAYGVVHREYDQKYWHAIGIPNVFEFGGDKYVRVLGKKTRSVYIRNAPNKSGKRIATAHGGDTFPLLGIAPNEPHWYNIDYNGQTDAWITNGKTYTEVIEK